MKTQSHAADTIADVAGEHAKHYVDVGVDTYNALADKTRALPKQIDGYVRQNTWVALGVAAGAGLLLGLLLRRR